MHNPFEIKIKEAMKKLLIVFLVIITASPLQGSQSNATEEEINAHLELIATNEVNSNQPCVYSIWPVIKIFITEPKKH